MRPALTVSILALLAALVAPAPAWAVPAQLNHQGRLSDLAGAPLTGVHSLTFNVYDSAAGGVALFSETLVVDMVDGYYSVQLGADALGNPLDDEILKSASLYLGLSVDGGPELAQRVRVSSVPYARLAGTATNLEGGIVDATLVQIGGTTVIDATGTYVGPGGTDTLAALSCNAGEVASYDGAAWVCAPLPSGDWNTLANVPLGFQDGFDDDSLMTLVCGDGQVVKYDAAIGMWDCADDLDTQLSDADVLAIISNNPVTLHPATTITWGAVTGKPAGFADNIDDDSLADLACLDGDHLVWVGGLPMCTPDTDSFAAFSCLDGEVITYVGGVATCGAPSDSDTLGALACTDGQVAKYDGSAGTWTCAADVDTDTDSFALFSCPDGQVLSYASGVATCMAIPTDADTLASLACADGQVAKYDAASGGWMCAADIDTDTDTDTDSFAGFSCPDGQVISFASGAAICATMSDSFADLGSTCADGEIARWDAASAQWTCSIDIDTDTDTVLSAAQVLGYVDGADLTLGPNSTLDGATIATGPHYTDADAIAAVLGSGGVDESLLPFNGLNEVSNGLLTNQFVNTYAAEGIAIPDNNPVGVTSTIAVPTVGTAEWLVIDLEISNSDISGVRVELTDPDGILYVLYDGSDTGTVLDTAYPVPTAPVSGDLTTWEGRDPVGDWTLRVIDTAFLNNTTDGSIVHWDVQFQYVSAQTVDVTGSLGVDADLFVTGTVYGGVASFTDLTTDRLTVNDTATINALTVTNGAFVDGGLQLGDSTATCDATTAGTLKFEGSSLWLCASDTWLRVLVTGAGDGSSQAQAGKSCAAIHDDFPWIGDGVQWIDPDGDGDTSDAFQTYCDMTRDGGGWTLVLQNVAGVGPGSDLTFAQSTTEVTVRGGTLGDDLAAFDMLVGLAYWPEIGTEGRVEVGATVAVPTHQTMYTTLTVDPLTNYALTMSGESITVGVGSPGLYTYHNTRQWTTYDDDNDSYGSNCAPLYGHPWWYGDCWSGSFWGGSGYQQAPYWTGSGADYYNWGAIWLR